jgi:hypothetical protein
LFAGTKASQCHRLYAAAAYLVSLCSVCALQNLQYFLNESFSGVVRLFLVVL